MIFNKCIQDAKKMGENLFPSNCLEILENHYKGRIENMMPDTLIKKVSDLMACLGEPDLKEIKEAVYDWMDS